MQLPRAALATVSALFLRLQHRTIRVNANSQMQHGQRGHGIVAIDLGSSCTAPDARTWPCGRTQGPRRGNLRPCLGPLAGRHVRLTSGRDARGRRRRPRPRASARVVRDRRPAGRGIFSILDGRKAAPARRPCRHCGSSTGVPCRAVLGAATVCITERVDSYPSRLPHAESKITSHSLKKGSIAADLDGPSMLTLL
jgi:hypothetical protein